MSEEQGGPLPVVAIVGRPNVGKSTLVNRFLGRRAAVVQDVPGVTRDRISYEALWNGKRFTVVDTGGWDPRAAGLGAAISRQAEYAMKTADVIVFVVDSQVGATDTDLAAARILRRSDRPVILVANKVDDERSEANAAELWSLGMGSRSRSARCTAAPAATCSTSCSRRCRPRRASRSTRAARAGWPSSAGPMWASPA
ncbi:GTPase [Blastococcus brunescens]|uniref:GTPase n=1 Tax=Blastococcus brunescens TaxID=1564165 RepID=A0ABZ1B6A5_9ACTN|nr:GTPase [Blastococcus sp. BMG 8361]WRL66345.1 GTPase [Blastococcus sp. BMG 8361]